MPKRNHHYRYQQDYYHHPSWLDWVEPACAFIMYTTVSVIFIYLFFFIDYNERKIDHSSNYKEVLKIAAKNCNSEIVKFLVRKNLVNIHNIEDLGVKLLQYAARGGCLEVVQFLLEKGVDINKTKCPDWSWWTRTPLHIVAEEGHLEIVKFLLQKGASPNIKGNDEKTPRDLVVMMSLHNRDSNKSYREIIDLLAQAEKQYKSEQ